MSENTIELKSLEEIPAAAWRKLAEKRIFFGHKSVGYNIIAGIKDLMRENPAIKLNIVESIDPTDFNRPLFAHSALGENRNPASKCEAFSQVTQSGIADKVDVASFKFCYADISEQTSIKEVFENYKQTLQKLTKRYPGKIFVHFTVPLKAVKPESRLKAVINKLKRKPSVTADNIQRNLFNDLMRREYSGKEPLFDIALYESVLPNGRQQIFRRDNVVYSALANQYTDDGGHLNEAGRKHIAEQLLILLVNLVQ